MTRPSDAALDALRERIARQTAEIEAGATPDPDAIDRIAAILAGPRLRRARAAGKRASTPTADAER